jgi:palmitoyltransferase ZDHHC2/15/20
MTPLDSPSSTSSPPPFGRKTRNFARRCERRCCIVATYFPLAFVYSLTTWAAYVEAGIGLSSLPSGNTSSWTAKPSSIVGLCLYALLNISYTVAVFTDPGSPANPRGSIRKDHHGYSHLPTTEPSPRPNLAQPITVSSTGAARYCKKCSHPKPDRTHHCSTCRRCVLKMDHHCPWLATCLGLHNYKPFVLFLVYTSLFCWVCFGSTAYWVWNEVLSEDRYLENLMPINVVLLAVISGIIGLVVTGFTSWHLWLCVGGMTTIECLEKTRYLRAVRSRVERQRVEALRHPHTVSEPHGVQERLQRVGDAVLEFHANAVPGATRLEEGEERQPSPSLAPGLSHPQPKPETMTPAQSSLARTYASHEADRERARYEDYLSEQESSKLPHAFNLGWRRNLLHLFGPKWHLWGLPVTNTTGDGWSWEVSQKWIRAVEEQAERRERDRTVQRVQSGSAWRVGDGYDGANDSGNVRHPHSPAGGNSSNSRPGGLAAMSMQTLKRPGRAFGRTKQRRELDHGENGDVDSFEVSGSDDSASSSETGRRPGSRPQRDVWRDWD